jgi:hypothetical protein
MRIALLAPIVAVITICGAAPVAAQSASFQRTDETYSHLAGLRQGALTANTSAAAMMPVSSGSRRQGSVLMIVGGAGIITGLIIGEDIVTIAGAGVAGVGLYFYLSHGGKVEVGARRSLPALGL